MSEALVLLLFNVGFKEVLVETISNFNLKTS